MEKITIMYTDPDTATEEVECDTHWFDSTGTVWIYMPGGQVESRQDVFGCGTEFRPDK